MSMSLPPTNGRVWPLASVLTITLGTPNGKARIAAVPITVPAEPPRAEDALNLASFKPLQHDRGDSPRGGGHGLAAIARALEWTQTWSRRRKTSSRLTSGTKLGGAERTGVDHDAFRGLRARRSSRTNATSSPFVSSVPIRMTAHGAFPRGGERSRDGG